MAALLETEARVTAKGQTTVPIEIRKALGVTPGDRITFAVDGSGVVTLRRAEEEHSDPAIGAFLEFLAHDISKRGDSLHALTPEFEAELRALVKGVNFDDDEPIEGDVGL